VQGTLRYAYKIGSVVADRSQKNAAEGAVFAASVLPLVNYCNPAFATTISSNVKFGLFDANTFPSFADVLSAMESTYQCLGITCAQVGSLGTAAEAVAVSCPASPPPSTPPPPPSPLAPVLAGATVVEIPVVIVEFQASGTVESYTAGNKTAIIQQVFATAAGVSLSDVTVTVRPASVIINVEITANSTAAAADMQTSLSTQMATPSLATAFLATAAITVETAPVIVQTTKLVVVDASEVTATDNGTTAVIIVIVIIAVLVLVGGGYFIFQRQRSAKSKPVFKPNAAVSCTSSTSATSSEVEMPKVTPVPEPQPVAAASIVDVEQAAPKKSAVSPRDKFIARSIASSAASSPPVATTPAADEGGIFGALTSIISPKPAAADDAADKV
jgi:hypothetical protein